MTEVKTSVLLQWTREEPTLARVQRAGVKVRFEEGTVREFDSQMAKEILHYKGFVLVTEDQLDKAQLKDLNEWREEKAAESADRQANRERKRLERLNRVQGTAPAPKGDEEKNLHTEETLEAKNIIELKDVLENEFKGLVEWDEHTDEDYKALVVKAILDAQKAAKKTNAKETPAQKAYRLKKEAEADEAEKAADAAKTDDKGDEEKKEDEVDDEEGGDEKATA